MLKPRSIEKKKKAGSLWKLPALSVVPEAAPKLSLETRMNARCGLTFRKMYPQMYPQTAKDTPPP